MMTSLTGTAELNASDGIITTPTTNPLAKGWIIIRRLKFTITWSVDSEMDSPDYAMYPRFNTQSVVTLIDSTTSKLQQLQQAFSELESHSTISLNLKWKELEEHFHGLEKSLKKRFDELEDQEKKYVTKVTEAQEMLEKQEAAVVSKELASLERLQEQRDAVLSALFVKYRTSSPELVAAGVSNGMADPILKENLDDTAAKSGSEYVCPIEDENTCTKPPSELIKLCEEMDAEGLHKFISDNRKNLNSIREEIPVALRSAPSPFSLVLDSLKGFYAGEILGLNGKKDGSLLGLRRTCLMLMESLEQLLANGVPDSLSDEILTPDIKEKAKVVAKEWKPKLDHLDTEASSGNSLEAHAFLQLLATFDIVSEFDQDEICKLIPAVTRPRFANSTCTVRYGRYIPVHQVIGTRTARYLVVPSKINHRRSTLAVGGRLREKSTVSGRLREKKGRRRRGGEKKEVPPFPVPSSPARRRRSRVA
ncbi:hypothetical protein BHM03_00047014 [Ensete ventricosum]|nr:hypothetical protein BHM03_00047014 [Ensete ventricosum]